MKSDVRHEELNRLEWTSLLLYITLLIRNILAKIYSGLNEFIFGKDHFEDSFIIFLIKHNIKNKFVFIFACLCWISWYFLSKKAGRSLEVRSEVRCYIKDMIALLGKILNKCCSSVCFTWQFILFLYWVKPSTT